MNQEVIKRTAEAVGKMKEYLNTKLQGKQVWENTHIQKQIERRKEKPDEPFSLNDHIRGMVYAMLSAEVSWKRMEDYIDETTGRLPKVDVLFHNYDIDKLLDCSVETLNEALVKGKDKDKPGLGLSGRSTKAQLEGLISDNIRTLKRLEDGYEGVDNYYHQLIEEDPSYRKLIEELSQAGRENKMSRMAEALTAEYLRNVGYDMAKPDKHICRILGKNILGCSEKEIAPIFESMDIVREIANYLRKGVAEVDYILWSYCATGYGDICTKERPLCCECVVREYCRKGQKKPCQKRSL